MHFRGKQLHLVVRRAPTCKHYEMLQNIATQYGMSPGEMFSLESFNAKEFAVGDWPISQLQDSKGRCFTPKNSAVLLGWGAVKEYYRVGELGMQAAETSHYACVSLGFTKTGRQPLSLLKASSDSVLSPVTDKDRRILEQYEMGKRDGC